MEKQYATRGALGTTILVAVPLFAILAAAFWYAASAWLSLSGPPMPETGYVALALGVVFSLLIGCGLMALLFYSSRHGYDEPYQAEESDSPPPESDPQYFREPVEKRSFAGIPRPD